VAQGGIAGEGVSVGAPAADEGAIRPSGGDQALPVKLVVWDLDDTLWRGTLSEGPVELDPLAVEAVKALNRRGILNSICSKNDPSAVRARLEEAGLWEEFVFPSIAWDSKGARLAQLIEDVQLRPPNVLFIDDLVINQEEAKHRAPGLRAAGPEILAELLSLPECAGKDDPQLSRLRQYKVLERKAADRRATFGPNDEFLRSCDIHVEVCTDPEPEVERLHELVLRTNQLNFTKRRPTRSEFDAMLLDPGIDAGYVRVRDRYGDYGICGFYAMRRSDRTLVDFLFSCRILDMGVEQWLYDYLGRPAVEGEGVGRLTGAAPVDWITLDQVGTATQLTPPKGAAAEDRTTGASLGERVLMMGGCDLNVVSSFLGGDVISDFSRPASSGAFMHVEHSVILRQAAAGPTPEQLSVVDELPFFDREAFVDKPVFTERYDVLVYSVLMDYTQGVYAHRATGLLVPWDSLDRNATDRSHWPALLEQYGSVGVSPSFLEWFAAEFEFRGPLDADGFKANVRWLVGAVPVGARVVFLNGAELPLDNPSEPGRSSRHALMNRALEEAVDGLANASICDVRRFVRREQDLRGDLRHYRRHVYRLIADDLRTTAASGLDFRRREVAEVVRHRKKRMLRQLRRMAGLTRRRLAQPNARR